MGCISMESRTDEHDQSLEPCERCFVLTSTSWYNGQPALLVRIAMEDYNLPRVIISLMLGMASGMRMPRQPSY